jgi:poly-gamma-glutamate capsule biosynthesis protein CapA/YwtB (metallophosphatase superfamily)
MHNFGMCQAFCTGRRRLYVLILATLVSGCSTPVKQISTTEPKPKPKQDISLSVTAVGDIMLGTNFPQNRLASDDGKTLLAPATPVLTGSDIVFGNLEGSLLKQGEPRKQCKDLSRCYLFRSPPHYARYLNQAGFNVMSLANNHARDFGQQGAEESMRHLDSVGILHTGQEGDIASWQVKGRKVAVIAYAPFIGSHDFLNIEKAQQQVRQLAQTHDIIIVSMHAGAEGLDVLHVPFKPEIFYGENRGDVVVFARAVIDAGADLVIGHGPHVPRALELYKGRLVAYSLGNFCTYYGISVVGEKGLAPVLKLDMDGEGRFQRGKIVSMVQRRPGGPVADPRHQAARLMKKLTEMDFPGTALSISPEGLISRVINQEGNTQSSGEKSLFNKTKFP